jgi:hypothetical protein
LSERPLKYAAYFSGRFYSLCSATVGGTLVARRAGTYVASSAMPMRNSGTSTKVTGSTALTPYSRLAINREAAIAATSPTPMPSSAGYIP